MMLALMQCFGADRDALSLESQTPLQVAVASDINLGPLGSENRFRQQQVGGDREAC